VALRFARVLRHRPDKRAEEADTLAAVQAFGSAAARRLAPGNPSVE
jgi:DNA ligase-1